MLFIILLRKEGAHAPHRVSKVLLLLLKIPRKPSSAHLSGQILLISLMYIRQVPKSVD